MKQLLRRLTLALVLPVSYSGQASAIEFDSDDYIVAGFFSGQVGVYDHDFSFKGYIDPDFPAVADVEFDPQGNVVAISQNKIVRVYDRSGALIPNRTFSNPGLGIPLDLEVSNAGVYFVGADGAGLLEVSAGGDILRRIGPDQVSGVTLVSDNVLWGGSLGSSGIIRSYRLDQMGAGLPLAAS